MEYYCTYFDRNYLAKGLALYDSLTRQAGDFRLWVLCLDDATFDALTKLALPHLAPIALADFEAGDAALLAAKANRSRIEYYFTCTPSLPLYIFRERPEVARLTYLDADLYFFDGPAPIFAEIGDNSIAIIEHRFPAYLGDTGKDGKYNVAWLTFRRDDNGLAALQWWRERCLEWCYDRPDEGRNADQKYLDDWPERFAGVWVLQHKGANLAPLNIGGYGLSFDGRQVRVEGEPLIFYHFHGFKQCTPWIYITNLAPFQKRLSPFIRDHIYAPYVRALLTAQRLAAPHLAGLDLGKSIRSATPASDRKSVV